MRVRTCGIVLLTLAELLAAPPGRAAPSRRATKAALGHEMVPHVSPDGSYSFLRPKGWAVTFSSNGATIARNPRDPRSARIDLLVLPTGGKLSSAQVIELLGKKMKEQYPSFALGAQRTLSRRPDVSAVLFTFLEGQVAMSGFGIAAASGGAVLWGDIYGSDAGFRGYDPASLLVYVMSSMNAGRRPRSPPLPKVARRAPPAQARTRRTRLSPAETRRRMRRAAVMTHYWNNFRLIHPGGVIWRAR